MKGGVIRRIDFGTGIEFASNFGNFFDNHQRIQKMNVPQKINEPQKAQKKA